MQATSDLIRGARKSATKELPTNLIRLVIDDLKDKLLDDFIRAYQLDSLIVRPMTTLIRPSDSVLKDLISKAKTEGLAPQSPELEKARAPGLKYVLKGALIPGDLRPTHAYASGTNRVYFVYEVDKKMYIHDAESTDEAKGIELKLVSPTLNTSFLYETSKELGDGSPNKATSEVRKKGMMHAVPSSGFMLGGGSTKSANRYQLLEAVKDRHGKKAMEYIVGSLGYKIKKKSKKAYKGVLAMLTGAAPVDAILLLEPHADCNQLRSISRNSKYLVSDSIVNEWDEDEDDDWQEHFSEIMEDMDEHSGVTSSFNEARAVFRVKTKRKLKKGKSPKDVSHEIFSELNEAYEAMARNSLGGKKVFKEEEYEYLHDRFGRDLGAYLQWHNLLFAAYDSMKPTTNTWLDYVNYGQPGQNFANEITRARRVEDFSELSKFAHFANSGHMPYLRCGCGDIKLTQVDGRMVAPADFETSYRWNELAAKKKKKRSAITGGAKPKSKSKSKPKKKCKPKRKFRFNEEDSDEKKSDEEKSDEEKSDSDSDSDSDSNKSDEDTPDEIKKKTEEPSEPEEYMNAFIQ